MPDETKPYHRGSLRADLIAAAVREVEAVGAAGVSLREVARKAEVSHAAPTHHFTDKTGLFTAIATEGFAMSAEAIRPLAYGTYGFLDGGAAYVLWALEHPGYFEVMYRPGLYRSEDPDLVEAKQAAFDVLEGSAADLASHWGIDDVPGLVLAGWSLCHGLATLTLAGNLEGRVSPDLGGLSAQLERGLAALGRVVETRLPDRS
ncbi:MAG: TetR/AcrR family transcriptional regulator [Marmoricola sp.]